MNFLSIYFYENGIVGIGERLLERESDRLYQVAKSEHIRSTIRFEIIQKHGLINEMRVAMGLEPHPSFDLAEESQP